MEAILGVEAALTGHRAALHTRVNAILTHKLGLNYSLPDGSEAWPPPNRPVLVRLMLLQRENSVPQHIVSELFDKRHSPTVARVCSHSPEAARLAM